MNCSEKLNKANVRIFVYYGFISALKLGDDLI